MDLRLCCHEHFGIERGQAVPLGNREVMLWLVVSAEAVEELQYERRRRQFPAAQSCLIRADKILEHDLGLPHWCDNDNGITLLGKPTEGAEAPA
ncbi:hypothetical protein Tco_0414929 [Tanacetum coccineum]